MLAELARLPASPARPVCELAQIGGGVGRRPDLQKEQEVIPGMGWPTARSVAATWGRKRFWLALGQSHQWWQCEWS